MKVRRGGTRRVMGRSVGRRDKKDREGETKSGRGEVAVGGFAK